MKFFKRKPFTIAENRTFNQKASFTGIMMSITLIFQYIERFVPLNIGIFNVNLSFLFILPIFYLNGFHFGFLAMIIRFIAGPLFSPTGYATLIVYINIFVTEMILVGLLNFFGILYYEKENKIILTLISGFTSIILISPLLNGLLFFPMMLMVITDINRISPKLATEGFAKLRGFFFGIQSYWGGMFATYGLIASITYGTIFSLYIPMSKVYVQLRKRQD